MADRITKLSTFCRCGHPMQRVSRKTPYVDASAIECTNGNRNHKLGTWVCKNAFTAEQTLDDSEEASYGGEKEDAREREREE